MKSEDNQSMSLYIVCLCVCRHWSPTLLMEESSQLLNVMLYYTLILSSAVQCTLVPSGQSRLQIYWLIHWPGKPYKEGQFIVIGVKNIEL